MTVSISNLHKNIHFTSRSIDDVMKDQAFSDVPTHFVDIGGSSCENTGLHISVIDAFCEMMSTTVKLKDVAIVVCPANNSPSNLCNACLLCGAYLLLSEHQDFQDVAATFQHVLQEMGSSRCRDDVIDCWKALDRARSLRWLRSASDEGEMPSLDVATASHYALPANGNVHVLLPGRLLLTPPPAQLPPGREWADVCEDGRPATRRFGAGFLADLLVDHDVSAVLCLGRIGGSDAAVLGARGLDVHDLALDPQRPALLPALDRLLTVSRAAPGCVAVFGYGDSDAAVGTLAKAWLMTGFGFDGGAAAAWVRLMCPRLRGSE